MRSWRKASISSSAFRFRTSSCPPMPMSSSPRRRPRAITRPSRPKPRICPSRSAVRTRAHRLLSLGLDDKLPNFRVDLGRLPPAVDLVLAVTREAYSTLDVPFHSRWRHFVLASEDRWQAIANQASWPDAAARARAEFDLAIVSVFLDAGAGAQWRYRDPATGRDVGRSEGLGIASLAMFADGAFSTQAQDRLRADAEALRKLTAADIARAFQVTAGNPLVGLDGRAD